MIDNFTKKTTILLGLVCLCMAGLAQIPDKFENLKVFPEDISKKNLMNAMRSFSMATGIRCNGCHVGEEGKPLSSYDFASDEKKEKGIARDMMRMVGAINNDYMAKIFEGETPIGVRCVTCHHGVPHPEPLDAKLTKAMEKDGLDGAVARYESLRDRYYGSDSFNFSEQTLNTYANQLAESGKHDEAIKFADLNIKYYPKSAFAYYIKGESTAQKGDKAKALVAFEKAAALAPKNPRIKQRIEQLKAE